MTPIDDAWTPGDIPDQSARTVVVTGTTVGGLGHHTALELARRGARVVLAGRTESKLDETETSIRAEVPAAELERAVLDLSDLGSVGRGAARLAALGPVDVLVNNAGVMGTPYSRTADGLELQLATNHFGPFLLTGLLLPQLVASNAGRVVAVSSQFHRVARSAPLGDPLEKRHYSRWPTYARTKLANLLFTYELDRRARRAGLPVRALAAHPGFAGTHLAANGQYGRSSGGVASILDAAIRAVSSQPADLGAWPSLMAVTADLPGATYVGPSGLGEMRGTPGIVTSSRLSHDEDAQRRLWELSERTTGISYP
ncbi:MAG: short-chain dehydrogenase/reductase [Nocardioides sp.]|nr:short-chain dehydrogenase/reductase [Nocardioides sp.]